MNRLVLSLVFLVSNLAFADAAKKTEDANKASPKKTYGVISTSMGNITVLLYDDKSPKTVANFVGLAEGTKEWTDPKTNNKVKKPFYNGLVFHRVIKDFMIQGGDPKGNGTGGPGYVFDNEKHPEAKHSKPGILAMANAGKNTNGSQFYITVAPKPELDEGYTVFGEVTSGMDVVYNISKVKTDPGDHPLTPVVIKSIKIERK